MGEDQLDLPFETLVVLAAGYMAYRLAFTGRDRSHKTADVVFSTVVFASIAKALFSLTATIVLWFTSDGAALAGLGGWRYLIALCAIAGTLGAGALWRAVLSSWVFNFWRQMRVSASDRHQTAWETMIANERLKVTQLLVRKKDGSAVMCEKLGDFSEKPFGPCLYGHDGSVAVYVTSYRSAGGSDWLDIDPTDPKWGSMITYIPASEISEISVRNIC